MNKHVDVLVIGGGLTGASLMLALAGMGFKTLLVEKQISTNSLNEAFDARSLALSPASVNILKTLGLWSKLQRYATSIQRIHVSEQGQFGRTILESSSREALGAVVEVQHVQHVLHHALATHDVLAPAQLTHFDASSRIATIHQGKKTHHITTKLLVAADGTDSFVRTLCGLNAEVKEYQQAALIANVGLSRSHHGVAFERFTRQGVLALLPMRQKRMALVWSMRPEQATQISALSDSLFMQALRDVFGYRLGRFSSVSKRVLYPLKRVIMHKQALWPVVFVGNAAHTLHPVAGQGFNLGLRDVALLAQCVTNDGLTPIMLDGYLNKRQQDQQAILRFTDGLIELFSPNLPGAGALRGMGLLALDNHPLVKHWLMRYTCGFGGVVPDLACNIPLNQNDRRPSTGSMDEQAL